MRHNIRTCVRGKNVILMPYKQCMVPKYHEWMQSPDLLQLTASESLTLEEEYEMQKKWMDDDDKCTFIILDLESYEKTKDEVGSMIGDTNLFFTDFDDSSMLTAEAEIMIAEVWARGQRRGWEAMILMLLYGIIELKVQQYQAKIGMNNFSSIQMFTKLGFTEVSRSDIFQEITMVKSVADEWVNWLKGHSPMNIIKIDDTL